jgi:pimeloyl-ACP methyl ester carboxylesterase
MGKSRVVVTATGPVEIVHLPGDKPPVLFFPGGHCSATSDCGWELYTLLGHELISFSRPGYGSTGVGRRTAAEFEPVVRDVCRELGVDEIAAVVGVSFGGLQAVHAASDPELAVPRLALHSCAPSTRRYPDTRAAAIGGPILFSPFLERVTWSIVRRMVRSDSGLRRMLSSLSTLPVDSWWGDWTVADREEARTLFQGMRSGTGFTIDLGQGRRNGSNERRDAISRVSCPTLVTASRNDAGVSFAHAEDFAALIPRARLVEVDSPSHLFWIGPGRAQIARSVAEFLAE